jgi:hypothetical protein
VCVLAYWRTGVWCSFRSSLGGELTRGAKVVVTLVQYWQTGHVFSAPQTHQRGSGISILSAKENSFPPHSFTRASYCWLLAVGCCCCCSSLNSYHLSDFSLLRLHFSCCKNSAQAHSRTRTPSSDFRLSVCRRRRPFCWTSCSASSLNPRNTLASQELLP